MVIELTDSSGYWLDIHFIRGKTRRLFYPCPTGDSEYMLYMLNNGLGFGKVLYTDDRRPVQIYRNGIAAIEVIEAVAPEASGDDTAETAN